jgi:HEPN domain-containing protein
MTNKEIVRYWVESAEADYVSMLYNFEGGQYVWALFIGHLVIEKLLKACCVRKTGVRVPPIHDLTRLAALAQLPLTLDQKRILERLTVLQRRTRYPDMQETLPRRITKVMAQRRMKEVEELRAWLLRVLQGPSGQ